MEGCRDAGSPLPSLIINGPFRRGSAIGGSSADPHGIWMGSAQSGSSYHNRVARDRVILCAGGNSMTAMIAAETGRVIHPC